MDTITVEDALELAMPIARRLARRSPWLREDIEQEAAAAALQALRGAVRELAPAHYVARTVRYRLGDACIAMAAPVSAAAPYCG